MSSAPDLFASTTLAKPPATRIRRTAEQKLADALNAANRAQKEIRKRERRLHKIRVHLAGEFLLAQAETDPAARALLANLKAGLTAKPAREAFGMTLPAPDALRAKTSVDSYTAEDVVRVEAQIADAMQRLREARAANNEAAEKLAEQDGMDLIIEWETMTGKLHGARPATWVKQPGSRKRVG